MPPPQQLGSCWSGAAGCGADIPRPCVLLTVGGGRPHPARVYEAHPGEENQQGEEMKLPAFLPLVFELLPDDNILSKMSF